MEIEKVMEVLQGDIEKLDECINDTEIDDDDFVEFCAVRKFVEFCAVRKEVFTLAVEALEKQLPKKIKEIHLDEYFCPTCGSENGCNDGKVEDKFCPECGQRLDWSDEQ